MREALQVAEEVVAAQKREIPRTLPSRGAGRGREQARLDRRLGGA